MALWNQVQFGFDIDDETINFGTRTIAENDGFLYETCTVATIQSPDRVDQKPNISASFQHSKLCVAIDQSFTIFQDETCNKILCNINFSSMIACYCISKDAFFLFVVLTNRTLYCLHIPDGSIIFTKTISGNQNNIINISLKEEDEKILIFLVTSVGAIYRFSDFYAKTLENAVTIDDKAMITKYITNIQCCQLFEGFTSLEFLHATVDTSSEELSIIVAGIQSIFVWSNEQHNNLNNVFSFGFRKIKPLKGSNKILGLRMDYTLSIVCPNTLLSLKICNKPVVDFTVIQHANINYCDILFLTKSEDNHSTYTLHLISYPDYESKLEINVSAFTYLLDILHMPNNILYMEGVINKDGIINTIRIKTISESVPEMRLARLLRKKQFDAAETFAEKLGLSIEPIYFSKAASFIEQLGPWAKCTPVSVNIDTLISILDKIKDIQYITECCSKAFISNYTDMRRLYLYAHERIIQNIKANDTDDQLNYKLNTSLSLINNTLHRLESFQMIQDIKHSRYKTDTLHDDLTMKEWIKFSQTNLLEECNIHLRMNEIQSATLIWIRHLPDIMKHVSKQTIRDLFATLPEDMSPSCLWPWLIHFIPTSLSLLPDAMDEIVLWGIRKLKCLEISHRTEWPEIGIDFAKKFIILLKFENHQHCIYFQQEHRYKCSALNQFMFLLQALSDIQRLNTLHRLKMPLDIYIDSPMEAIYMLLDKIHVEEIDNFVNIFLKQYLVKNNVENDAALCAYIQKTIKRSSSWWSYEEAIWEKKVTIIISLIHNIENRLQQTLEILRRALVPWSLTIVTLAETYSNFDHNLSFKIKIEYDYVPVKSVLKKYGYTAMSITDKIISRIIKEDRDSMINDINILTKNDQQLRKDAFCRCINTRLNEGNLQRAMDIIDYLENNAVDILYYYEGIINYVVAVHTLKKVTTSLVHQMEILGCLEFKMHNLLAKPKVCPFRCNNIINTIKDLRSLHVLNKNYKADVSLKNYRTQKSVILQNCVMKTYSSIKEDNLSLIYKTVIKIAELLGLGKLDAILSLSEYVKNMETLLYLVVENYNELNIAPDEFKNINNICLLALQCTTTNIDTIKAVKNLSASVLNTCQDNYIGSALLLHTCVNVCPSFFIQHCSDLKQETAPKPNWKLYTIYKDQTISLDQELFSLLESAIHLHLFYSGHVDVEWNIFSLKTVMSYAYNLSSSFCNIVAQYHSNQIMNHKIQMDKLLISFLENMKSVQLQHNDYSLLQIFKKFYFMYCSISTRNEFTLSEIKSILSQLLINLLKKVCTGWSFDLHLGLSCLFMLPEQEAYTWISTISTSFSTDYNRHSIISTLGYEYSRLGKNQSLMQMFEDKKLLHIWAQQLQSHCSIAYKDVLINNASSKREVLQQIITSNNENVIPLLKNYCYNFGFNFDYYLLLYLQTLLKTWKPTINVSDTSLNEELCIHKDEVDELKKKCDAVIEQMENKSVLYTHNIYKHIPFYHYEVFIILMDLIQDKNMKKRNFLCFLQNYTRSSPPTSMEHDKWIQFNPEYSTLPHIAQWRLPFLFKVDIWELITPELNLRTYDRWLDIAPTLNLEAHSICILAIKNEVNCVWEINSTKSDNTAWSLHPKNSTLFNDIKKCIQRFTDSDGSYYVTAALYYVMNRTPPGADRVIAAKECYKYAQIASQKSARFEEGMLNKIKFKYLKFTSEHILRSYGLEKDKYLSLIENPDKLVHELYKDESIPLRYRIATDYRPDINATINELGKLYSLNTIKLRLELLQEWLHSNTRYTELSQSLTETVQALKDSEQNIDYEDDILRACYVLEYEDRDLLVQFLINIGLGDHHGDAEYDYNARYRALRVLQIILDIATLEELTKRDVYTFRKYMKSLQYIGKLESLGLCYSIDIFETCSKRELVQILWKTQRHLPCALFMITEICIEFEIYDVLFWDDTLSQMTNLRMINELKKVLLQLRSKSVIVNCDGYKKGWQLIISEPFRQMNINPNLEQINNCVEIICLLYSCPITCELDFTLIVKNCFECKQEYLAAALLPFLTECKEKLVLKKIKEDCKIIELETELNNLSSKGVLTVARSLAIIQNMS